MLLYLWMFVQVIAENLPISSSGHVVLMHEILQYFFQQKKILVDLWAYDYFLQGISAIVFLLYFFSSWWQLIIKGPLNFSKLLSKEIWIKNIIPVFLFGIVADGITFVFWLLKIDQFLHLPLIVGFMITAGVVWSNKFTQKKIDIDIWSMHNGFIVGLVQGLALLPGISRFGTTFTTLCWLGYRKCDAFSISFLIQWPLIFAGSLMGLKTLSEFVNLQNIITLQFIIFTLISAVIAYSLLHVVQKIIDKNLFWKFSYYMIIPITLALFV